MAVGLGVVHEDAQDDAAQGGATEAVEAQKDELLKQFLELLGEDPSLDSAAKAQIQNELVNALDAVDPSSTGGFEAPDRAVWMDAAKALQSAGAVSDEEANTLFRQLDDALSAFERKESRLAMEFSRRMARDGEASALAWLQQNREVLLSEGGGPAHQAMANGIGGPPVAMPADTTQSRARRVRGPPRIVR